MKIVKSVLSLLWVLGMAATFTSCQGTGREGDFDRPLENVATAPSSETNPGKNLNGGAKVLVAYFSCTGNTKTVAGYAAQTLHADVYQIVPETAYTAADLNYGEKNSRTSIEQNDPSARPAIAGTVENMDEYDIVFLGYPIWWGQAPKILYTFLESYDFSDKKIVPFCTSGSSGVGSSDTGLHPLTPESAQWLPGTRFPAGTTQNEIAEWIKGLA